MPRLAPSLTPPPKESTMQGEFMKFLKEYGVIGLAIGVIIGSKAGELVKAIVDGLLMPIVGLILPKDMAWETWVIQMGGSTLKLGLILSGLVNFIIVAYLVFWFSKMVLKEEQVTKK
jgi:large conductance mechanosensitive channel